MISRDAAETRAAGYQVPTYSEDLLAPGLAVLRDRLPHLDLIDMHVHVGRAAPAGLLATEEEAVTSHALAGAHGVVLRLKEPGGYREPNERVLQLAHTSDGRITALARLDPGDDRPARRSARAQAASAGGGVRPRRPAARRRVRARRRGTAPHHDPRRPGRARDDRSGAPPQPRAPGGAADPGALRRRHLRRHLAPDRRLPECPLRHLVVEPGED